MTVHYHPMPLTRAEIERFKAEWLRVFPLPAEPEKQHSTGPAATLNLLREWGIKP